MLLAGLQSHPQSRIALCIDRYADNTAGKLPFESVAGGKKSRVGTTVAHRYAEPLRRANHHVGTHFAGRSQQCQRQQISSHGHGNVEFVSRRDKISIVEHLTV